MQLRLPNRVLAMAILPFCLLGAACAQKPHRDTYNTAVELPRVFCLSPVKLTKSKARLTKGDESLQPALKRLRLEADDALKQGPFSVMYKKMTPPSGDKHDYMSRGS